MNKEELYEVNTSSLKELFRKADNSGKVAWRIGNLLIDFSEGNLYRVKYKTFEEFTIKEFGKTGQTARTYIKIRKKFKLSEISENMLVTHLKVIVDFKNSEIGKKFLHALDKITSEKDTELSSQAPSTNDIKVAASLLSETKNLTADEVLQTLKSITEESKKEISKKRKKKSSEEKVGRKLKSPAMKKIENFFENEPIDEMGTVALFCTMFPYLKKIPFKLNNQKLFFESIQYVRTPFPDCSIRVKQTKRKKDTFKYLKIEFEFESLNFIKHKHIEDKRFDECKLIICWKDNIIGNSYLPQNIKKKLPEIIELSEILETGQIEVKNIIFEESKADGSGQLGIFNQ